MHLHLPLLALVIIIWVMFTAQHVREGDTYLYLYEVIKVWMGEKSNLENIIDIITHFKMPHR